MNTFNSPGIVSRNNKTLNDKSNTAKDKGMQSYYDLLSQEGGKDTISQFNHPRQDLRHLHRLRLLEPHRRPAHLPA